MISAGCYDQVDVFDSLTLLAYINNGTDYTRPPSPLSFKLSVARQNVRVFIINGNFIFAGGDCGGTFYGM